MSFDKFTDKARKVLVLAQEEARALHQPYVGTEHVLLALLKEKEGLAAQALDIWALRTKPPLPACSNSLKAMRQLTFRVI